MQVQAKKINYPYLPEGREIKYVGLDNPFMQAAKKATEKSGCLKQSTGAVLVKNGKIIETATNASVKVTKCPRIVHECKTGEGYHYCKETCQQEGHSEELAVKRAMAKGLDTSDGDIYLWGHWWCCKPCWDAMNTGNIKNVYLLENAQDFFTFSARINKIYISGALNTDLNGKLRKIYENLSELCKTLCSQVYVPHLAGTDPIKNPEVTPQAVWEKDFEEVTTADLTIAYVGTPSLGVGAELEWAREYKREIILWWFEGDNVSRLPKGNPAVKYMIVAKDFSDLEQKLKEIFKNYR